jgi:hypothetical protein
MNGYLLREQAHNAGEAIFIDCINDINKYAVAFEDDTDTGYFYAFVLDAEGKQLVLDALHIYNIEEIPEEKRKGIIRIVWSKDWQRCALVINNYCHAIFDFENHGGYCRNEFPPPNEFWTKGERTLTNEMVTALFR